MRGHDALLDEYRCSHRDEPPTSRSLARALLTHGPMRVVYVVMVVIAVATRSAEADMQLPRSRCEVLAWAIVGSAQIFVGRVEHVAAPNAAQVEVTFAILDPLRGAPSPAPVVIHMSSGRGASCTPLLARGNELLVVARNGYAACADARLRSAADDDIAFVRGFGQRAVGYIAGEVALYDQPYGSMSHAPRAGVEVRVPHTAFSTRTAADGSYRLEVPPGRYRVEIVEPDPRLALAWTSRDRAPVEAYERACAAQSFSEVWNGRIRGRLVDHQGKPAASVRVFALEASRPLPVGGNAISYEPNTLTDFDGYYELDLLPPGSYAVAVSLPFEPRAPIPTTFYPGVALRPAAKLVQLGRGTMVAGIDFQLRAPRPLTDVAMVVARPPANASLTVRLTNVAEQRASELEVWDGGANALPEEIGARATLQACLTKQRKTCGPPVRFVVKAGAAPIRIEAP